jgi:hypothetical protein
VNQHPVSKRTSELQRISELKQNMEKRMKLEVDGFKQIPIPMPIINGEQPALNNRTLHREHELFVAFAEIAGHGNATRKLVPY